MVYRLKVLTTALCLILLSACGGNPPKSEAKRQFDVCMKPLLGPEFFMKCEETMGPVECTKKYQKKQRGCKDAFLESKKDCNKISTEHFNGRTNLSYEEYQKELTNCLAR